MPTRKAFQHMQLHRYREQMDLKRSHNGAADVNGRQGGWRRTPIMVPKHDTVCACACVCARVSSRAGA